MKIIKKGDPTKINRYKPRKPRFECPWCDAVFECEEYEYTMEPGQLGDVPTADCPECGKKTSKIVVMRQ